MILQALTQYYEELLAAGKITRPGWAKAKVSFALDLDDGSCCTCSGKCSAAKRRLLSRRNWTCLPP